MKSTACANLPGALCIDLEGGGYDYIDAVKVKASSVKDLKEICAAIKEAKYPYKFIVLDTITRLEEMVKPLALKLYLNSLQDKSLQEMTYLVHQWVNNCAPFNRNIISKHF